MKFLANVVLLFPTISAFQRHNNKEISYVIFICIAFNSAATSHPHLPYCPFPLPPSNSAPMILIFLCPQKLVKQITKLFIFYLGFEICIQ